MNMVDRKAYIAVETQPDDSRLTFRVVPYLIQRRMFSGAVRLYAYRLWQVRRDTRCTGGFGGLRSMDRPGRRHPGWHLRLTLNALILYRPTFEQDRGSPVHVGRARRFSRPPVYDVQVLPSTTSLLVSSNLPAKRHHLGRRTPGPREGKGNGTM